MAILVEVSDEKLDILKRPHVDLMILPLKEETEAENVPDLIVDSVKGDMAYMTYISDDGELGELIPLEISRIKKVTTVEK
jgi:hypothetical protein